MSTSPDTTQSSSSALPFLLLTGGTVLGLAGIDLVLPAIPTLPEILGGTSSRAQWVLASYTIGSAVGLLLYGELGARYCQRRLLIASLLLFALTSILASLATTLDGLIAWRFAQGVAGAAAAVFAPGMIRALFDDKTTVRAFGLLGSLESLTPALAPLVGAWLLSFASWTISFEIIAVGSALLGCLALLLIKSLPDLPPRTPSPKTGQTVGTVQAYKALFGNWQFLGAALSHAFNLGGLLVFVFSAPAVVVNVLDGSISDFIWMQVVGISCFIIASNSAQKISETLGAYRQVWIGGLISLSGGIGLLILSLNDQPDPIWLIPLFLPVNIGLGLRGPIMFNAAIAAAGDQSARGGALLVLLILASAATGTALVAPFIEAGLFAPALGLTILSLAALAVIPRRASSTS